MDDCENLVKLLSHFRPDTFRTFLTEAFGLTLPVLNPKEPKRAQRAVLRAALAALDAEVRRPLEEVAEGFVLLTDGAGRDVVEGYGKSLFDDAERTAFAALRNQYDRVLWLYRHAPETFKTALNAREADVFRQSTLCYDGYQGVAHLTVQADDAAREAFLKAACPVLGCPPEEALLEIFQRRRPNEHGGQGVDLYQITLRHNRPRVLEGYIHNGAIETQEVVRMDAAHITYEPANGHLEVLARHRAGRETLARLAADHLLAAPISGAKIPLKQYDYQCLAGPFAFDLAGEPVAAAKVTELGFSAGRGRSLHVKLPAKDPEDVQTVGRILAGPQFDFHRHRLDYARLAIRLKKVGNDRARTVVVILREDNRCNIKTKREKDRALCDRLLAKWHLVKEIGDAANAPVHNLAA